MQVALNEPHRHRRKIIEIELERRIVVARRAVDIIGNDGMTERCVRAERRQRHQESRWRERRRLVVGALAQLRVRRWNSFFLRGRTTKAKCEGQHHVAGFADRRFKRSVAAGLLIGRRLVVANAFSLGEQEIDADRRRTRCTEQANRIGQLSTRNRPAAESGD